MPKNSHGFDYTNGLIEDYLTRSRAPTGRTLKDHEKAAARAAGNTFAQTTGSKDHRRFFQSCLEGAGVDFTEAEYIAKESAPHAIT